MECFYVQIVTPYRQMLRLGSVTERKICTKTELYDGGGAPAPAPWLLLKFLAIPC